MWRCKFVLRSIIHKHDDEVQHSKAATWFIYVISRITTPLRPVLRRGRVRCFICISFVQSSVLIVIYPSEVFRVIKDFFFKHSVRTRERYVRFTVFCSKCLRLFVVVREPSFLWWIYLHIIDLVGMFFSSGASSWTSSGFMSCFGRDRDVFFPRGFFVLLSRSRIALREIIQG